MKRILFLLLFISCNRIEKIEFDRNGWNQTVDGIYINREKMLDDLVNNHLHKGFKRNEVIELLGQPEKYNSIQENVIIYDVVVRFDWNDIDPKGEKQLCLEFVNDSILSSYEVKIYKKN